MSLSRLDLSRSHQAKKWVIACRYALRVCSLRTLVTKNSRKRSVARSPALAIVAGITIAPDADTMGRVDSAAVSCRVGSGIRWEGDRSIHPRMSSRDQWDR